MTFKDIPLGDKTRQHLAARELALTGKKFCPTCQMPKPVEGGVQKRHVWRCKLCSDRAKNVLKEKAKQAQSCAVAVSGVEGRQDGAEEANKKR